MTETNKTRGHRGAGGGAKRGRNDGGGPAELLCAWTEDLKLNFDLKEELDIGRVVVRDNMLTIDGKKIGLPSSLSGASERVLELFGIGYSVPILFDEGGKPAVWAWLKQNGSFQQAYRPYCGVSQRRFIVWLKKLQNLKVWKSKITQLLQLEPTVSFPPHTNKDGLHITVTTLEHVEGEEYRQKHLYVHSVDGGAKKASNPTLECEGEFYCLTKITGLGKTPTKATIALPTASSPAPTPLPKRAHKKIKLNT